MQKIKKKLKENMAMTYAILGFISAIGLAISIFGYRYEIRKTNYEREENAISERTKMSKDLKELKILYKERIEKKSLQVAQELSRKYDYGFVLFGIIDDVFVFPTVKQDSKIAITADWNRTKLVTNSNNSNFYDLTLRGLKQSGSFGNNNSLNLTADNYRITFLKLSEEKAVEISLIQIFNEARLFFELVDNSNEETPIYAIGFKK